MSPLVVENVAKSYRQGERVVQALRGVSLDVPAGKFIAIMGASGSGKSTLLHLMAGLTQAEGGRVMINSQDIGKLTDAGLTHFRRTQIGLVFQAFNLIPTLTARENILLPLRLERRLTSKDDAHLDSIVKTLGLGDRLHHRPDALSGGEQQRVAIGRALINNPAVVLADEPTGNLDSVNSRAVCELLRSLCTEHGKTIVMVTHEPSVAVYASAVVIIKDGQLIDTFETKEINGQMGLAERYARTVK